MAPSEKRKPTMRDVCKLAGVSAMTVSRVLGNAAKVSPETRLKVLRAVEQIGYVPDQNAGSLSSNKSHFVALVLPTLTNSNFGDTAEGLTEILGPAGYQPLIGYSRYRLAQEEAVIRAMLARRPDAIVVAGAEHSKASKLMLHQSGVPVIEIWDRPQQPIDISVGYSNEEAGRLAARHLISLGHRRIAAIGASEDGEGRDFRGEQRLSGFAAALVEAGLSDELIIREDEIPVSFTHGAKAMSVLLERAPDVEAVFAVSDLSAVGAVMECNRRGIPIPEQISIIGFGNFEVGRQCVPSLTTISIDAQLIGRKTGQILLELLNSKEPSALVRPVAIDLGFELFERGSTAERAPQGTLKGQSNG
jgi:LacI family gluconate utilization system Gnt-I transcriptional repressor